MCLAMAKLCSVCGNQLSFLRGLSHSICIACENKIQAEEEKTKLLKSAEKERIKKEIIRDKAITNTQIETLKTYDKTQLSLLYGAIVSQFEQDGGLKKNEILTLQKMQESLGLTNDEINYEEKVLPHIFIESIKSENQLPTITVHLPEGISNIVLKKGEQIHYGAGGILKESRVVQIGYEGGSQGVSFRIAKGISYRVGAHKGHIRKEEQMIETSRGALIITNKRLLMQPLPGQKPIGIALNKILSYHCFENGVEFYKEGREKGYFFQTFTAGSPEIFGIILEFLLRTNNEVI